MPVVGSDFRGSGNRDLRLFKIAQRNKEKRRHSSQQMDGVRPCKNVEKTAGVVARNVHALRHQLSPSHELSTNKYESHQVACEPQPAKADHISKKKARQRTFQREGHS